MKTCEQFPGVNVLQHGQDVHKWFVDLYSHLYLGTPLVNKWKIPDWVYSISRESLIDFKTLRLYHIYHDCGKPFVIIKDDKGTHFPNHARVSKEVWLRHFPEEDQVADLIGMDMDAHTIKACDIEEFLERKECASLLLTALCEIHSNAMMKDGIETIAFKIKWKRLNRIGKRYASKLVQKVQRE